MKEKEDYLKALHSLLDTYDAFYLMNKYGDLEGDLKNNTNREDFILLRDLIKEENKVLEALYWILNCYDCYYKEDIVSEGDTAFSYLEYIIEEKFKSKK